ncbi:uncharacterized protein METZ01_LOCUS517394, partial [marine metagenome]
VTEMADDTTFQNVPLVYTDDYLTDTISRLKASTGADIVQCGGTTSTEVPPSTPRNLLVGGPLQVGETYSVYVSWTEPVDSGTSPIIDYSVVGWIEGSDNYDFMIEEVTEGPETQATLNGLEPGSRYEVRVFAWNKADDPSDYAFYCCVGTPAFSQATTTRPPSTTTSTSATDTANPTTTRPPQTTLAPTTTATPSTPDTPVAPPKIETVAIQIGDRQLDVSWELPIG